MKNKEENNLEKYKEFLKEITLNKLALQRAIDTPVFKIREKLNLKKSRAIKNENSIGLQNEIIFSKKENATYMFTMQFRYPNAYLITVPNNEIADNVYLGIADKEDVFCLSAITNPHYHIINLKTFQIYSSFYRSNQKIEKKTGLVKMYVYTIVNKIEFYVDNDLIAIINTCFSSEDKIFPIIKLLDANSKCPFPHFYSSCDVSLKLRNIVPKKVKRVFYFHYFRT